VSFHCRITFYKKIILNLKWISLIILNINVSLISFPSKIYHLLILPCKHKRQEK